MVEVGELDLKVHELVAITEALRGLQRSGIRTDNITVGNHRVLVRWVDTDDDPRETGYWIVRGIERART